MRRRLASASASTKAVLVAFVLFVLLAGAFAYWLGATLLV